MLFVFHYLIVIMPLEFIIFKCPSAWEIKRALSDEIEGCVRNILSVFFWVAAQFGKYNLLKLEQKHFGGGWEVRLYVAVLGKWQRKDAEDPLLWPCWDQALPGVREESRCILYQLWGRFLGCFGQSAMPRGCPSCASGAQQPAEQWGGLWHKDPAPLQTIGNWAVPTTGEPVPSPALMEELAGEAGLGSRFLCVCGDFQALHRSQDWLLGLAPPSAASTWNAQWAVVSTAVCWEGNRSVLGQVLISISAQVMMTVAVLCVGNEERDVPELPCLQSSQVQLVSSSCRCNSQGGGSSPQLQLSTSSILPICQLLLGSRQLEVEKWDYLPLKNGVLQIAVPQCKRGGSPFSFQKGSMAGSWAVLLPASMSKRQHGSCASPPNSL